MRRVGLVLAAMAALGGAPSAASAASANPIVAAAVSPTSGTIATIFRLSVDYHAADGTSALAVSASVADRAVELLRTSGTAASGTWTGTVTALPPGTWPVSFRADVQQGKDATLAGPVISVTGPATSVEPAAPSAPEPTAPVASIAPQQPAPAVASPAEASAPPSSAAAPAATPLAAGSASTAAAASPLAAIAATPHPAAAVSAAPAAAGQETAHAVATAPASGAPDDDDNPAADRLSGRMNPWLWPLAGASAAAATLVGLFWLLTRPESDDDELATSTGMRDALALPTAAEEATELLVRRTLRHARMRLPEDPIVAALDVDAEADDSAPTEPSAESSTRRAARRD